MSVDVTAQVRIERPRSEVARTMFDPSNDKRWTTGVVECRARQPGPLRRGHEVERISSFLGRKLSYLIRVVDADDDHFVEMAASEPFEMRVRYQLDDDGDATLASIRTRGGGTGFFQIAAPLLGKMVRRSILKDLQNLKRELEQ